MRTLLPSRPAFSPLPTVLPAALRARLAALEPGPKHGVLRFGDPRIDGCLAGGGLALGALHEVTAEGLEAETGALAAAFIACLVARMGSRPVFWVFSQPDLHPPGLLAYGLDPGRLLMVQAARDEQVLAAAEAALRAGSAAAVVAEAGRFGRIASRRLQLACLKHGSTGFVLRRWPHGRGTLAQEQTASVTSWRLAAAPSARTGGEPGRPRWRLVLDHARGGVEGEWTVEPGDLDGAHPVHVVAELADPAAAPAWRLRA